MRPDTTRRDILIGLAGLSLLTAIAQFFEIARSDFVMFYDSGRAWLSGSPIYTADAPNLSPPLAVALLFAPLASLPLQAARALWFALSVLACVWSIRIVVNESRWSRSQAITLIAGLMLTYPAWLAWYQGQLSWVLALPATLSWRAYRHGRLAAAGIWLAPVIAIKPPFALVALFLPLRLWVPAGLAAAGLTLVSIAITGIQPWLDWWAFRDAVFWITWVDNLSLWGQFGRIALREVWQVRLSNLPMWVPVAIGLIGLAMYARVQKESDADRRMALAWLSGTLVSPIGWVYYLVVGVAPLLAGWTPTARWPWLLCCVPLVVFYPLTRGPWAWVVGSIYSVAAIWLWCAYVTHAPTSTATIASRTQSSSHQVN